MSIKIPKDVFDGIEYVRQSGVTNMLDYYRVQKECFDHDFYEATIWLGEHKKEYVRGVFESFEVEE